MIGSGLKKLAAENGMKVDKGVGYGSLGGFAATLSEGAGTKQIMFTTVFTDSVRRAALMDQVNSVDIKKHFRVQDMIFLPRGIQVVFADNPGTMKKIQEFLDWFLPLLRDHSATPANVCTECGQEIMVGRWVLVNGTAYYFHPGCAEKVRREIEESNDQRKRDGDGSYLMGLVGALAGSALGAVVWAVILSLGYVASVIGLLIGWLADKGYNLLGGKQGKAKVLILILAVAFGVLLGTFASDAFTLMGMIGDGELPGFSVGDIPLLISLFWEQDSAYRSATISNILMGLLFAALGVFGMLWQTGKDVSGMQYIELK